MNKLTGFEIVAAEAGAVTLALDLSRGGERAGAAGARLLNHAGALHAGVQAALLDTACGYAAGTLAGNVVTLQLNLQFLSSAKGDRFEARARVTKAGKAQLFAAAELVARQGGAEVLAPARVRCWRRWVEGERVRSRVSGGQDPRPRQIIGSKLVVQRQERRQAA